LSGDYFFLAEDRKLHRKVHFTIANAVSAIGGFLSLLMIIITVIGRIFAVNYGIGRIINLLHSNEICTDNPILISKKSNVGTNGESKKKN